MKPAIVFNNVSYTYKGEGSPVLKNISFAVEKGSFMAIVGNNGAGKTTISKLMNGLLKPGEGEVFIAGTPTSKQKTSKIARKIGMLFQNPGRQICQNTVYDELAFGLRIRHLEEAQIRRRIEPLLQALELQEATTPYTLSRGQQQMLALASVMLLESEILILDEPTTGLDYQESLLVMQQVKKMNQAGTTVIMICHDMDLVLAFAKRVLVVSQGSLIAEGAPDSIFRNEQIMEQAALLPPQIIELSLHLQKTCAYGYQFSGVKTTQDVIHALREATCSGKREAV